MDKRITFRFFQVTRRARSRLSFGDALTQIKNIRRKVDRERQLASDFHVRAEHVESAQGSIYGEMTRIQRSHFPSEISGEDRIPLQTNNPLGHSIVFRYLPGSSQLGIQYDPRVLSPSRFIQYVEELLQDGAFDLEPVIRTDMWDKFRQSPVRKISIAVASPADVAIVQRGEAAAVTSSMKSMAEAYEAPKITIELSMGSARKGSLGERVKGIMRHFRQEQIDGRLEVERMEATIKNEGERAEDLNLLDDILSFRKNIELVERDHDANYRICISALRDAMHEWI